MDAIIPDTRQLKTESVSYASVIQEGETLHWQRKRYRRAEAFGNIARNAEIFVYGHVLNLAARVVRVKLSYQNRTERSLAAQSSLS